MVRDERSNYSILMHAICRALCVKPSSPSLLGVDLGSLLPLLLLRSSTGNGGAEHVVDVLGDLELAELPLEVLAGRGGLLSAEGGSVDVMGVSLVGRSVANQGGDL